ncbi:hypothetical protein [Candidatus Nitrosacidococcus sp. I8]|uniref:hypothetical protein n=1 Tax=Candidatus Nitrosacidococcus sp. I8 TaxID=2942908 RepID=UPI002226E668|nr:hypothetical protein [Candidatus Nitrosacidococcus sp. I8]CAH9019855.1 hypothetical protein NURINAE_01780 [Candidatus Nitrosacidococcus sp. I8]
MSDNDRQQPENNQQQSNDDRQQPEFSLEQRRAKARRTGWIVALYSLGVYLWFMYQNIHTAIK